MHIPADLAALSAHQGPFGTVYLDTTRTSESGAKEVELRWRALREHLESAGADEATLAALDDAAGTHLEVAGARGQLLVAADGTVLLDRVLARAPLRPLARWSPLPHLMPFFAQAAPQVPHVLVVADRTGADVLTVGADAATAATLGEQQTVVGSEQYPIHKVGRDQWDERHFQNRVDNSWAANAADVTAEVRRHVDAIGARMVVVAGDERARALLGQDLPAALPPSVAVEQVEAGGRAAGSSSEALDDAVHGVVLRFVWRERRQVLERLRQGVGRHDYGVLGLAPVLEALRKAQVDTLVLSDDPSSTLNAAIGQGPLQLAATDEELADMGVSDPEHDRLDAALVRALAGSSAQILVTPDAHAYLDDGIGAVLRYADRRDDDGVPSTG
ncbi:MAG: Vms1/Ankzf1 family peptidyl-tRNA hydrolase [bacterium]